MKSMIVNHFISLFSCVLLLLTSPLKSMILSENVNKNNQHILSSPVFLDTSFNHTGIVPAGYSGGIASYSVAIQPDGKIVTAGCYTHGGGNSGFAVARFNSDGTPDVTFGTEGIARTIIIAGEYVSLAYSVSVMSDGKIIAAGFSSDSASINCAFIVVRFNSNGSIDTSFNHTGMVRNYILGGNRTSDYANSIVSQPDGKIVVSGSSINSSGFWNPVVERLNPDGSFDTSFNHTGMLRDTAVLGDGSHQFNGTVAIQNDGKILVSGFSSMNNGELLSGLFRYNIDGSADTTFNSRGYIKSSSLIFRTFAIQADGKIITTTDQFNIMRFNSNGALDLSFGSSGIAENINIKSFFDTTYYWSYDARIHYLVIKPDGKIVSAGIIQIGADRGFFISQHNIDGSLDKTFGYSGALKTIKPDDSLFEYDDWLYSAAIQPDGKIIAVGNLYIARYLCESPHYALISSATDITKITAVLNGSVYPVGNNFAVRFLYGKNPGECTDSIEANPFTVSGKELIKVSAVLNNLIPGNVYYYCLSITCLSPPDYFRSNDISFKTAPPNFKWGSALGFNGTSQYAHLGRVLSSLQSGITLESWIKWNGSNVNFFENIFYNGNAGSLNGYGVYITESRFVFFAGAFYRVLNTVVPSGVWTHVALTCSSSNDWTIYINGKPTSVGNYVLSAPKDDFLVGGNSTGDDFCGWIDEVRFSDTLRYLSAFVPDENQFTSDLHTIGLYHFNEGIGQSAADISGNSNNLMLIHSPIWGGLYDTLVAVRAENFKGIHLPKNFCLYQNYPNPFNPVTTISYTVPINGHVTIKLYDILGRELAILVNEEKTPGYYNVRLSANELNLASGIYYYRIESGKFIQTMKLMIIK